MEKQSALITLGGKDYKMSALSDKDINELDDWLRELYVSMVRKSLKDVDPSSEQYRVEMGLAHKEAMALTWMSGQGAKMMASLKGVARMVWQGIKRNHSGVSYDDIAAAICDPSTLEYAQEKWDQANGVKRTPVGKGQRRRKASKKAKRKSTKR